MSATAVHAGQAAHSPYSPDASYLNHNPEAYYNNVAASGSGSLNSRADRRQQGYGPQPPQQYSLTQSEPMPNTTSSIPYHIRNQPEAADQYDGTPNVPTRTSSQQQGSPHTPTAPSTAPLEQRVATSRQARQHAAEDGRDRSRDDTVTAAANAARNRRKGPASPEGPQRATSTRERNHQANGPSQSRSEAAIHPAPLVREPSEVINRVVVSDPRVDEERMQERVAEAQPAPINNDAERAPPQQDAGPGPARRQDYSKSSSKRRDVQFGDYVLGQTLGEGEFGKVKLGWKKDGSTQVAIKLIRRDTVQNHPGRLPKIYREISILRDLAHPNIVRLHEMVETERHIGIILEYASGGELFDYILNHRYLKDPAARRLFAQLVSGVGYLHKKGIVHRDLKLENLLLDQNRNIIITDFGFANTFNPTDMLSDEIEYNLSNKDYIRKFKLDRVDDNGLRRGDLMQTSCGSPCYAAPELVVSDSLYTGRKVDVWSCGVILYAMLAGYLPFDDDPANPEGDNINLLYKYITTTPLTFPEYVSPHARDLLRRILVPDPRKRADLFEVARHSWLSEYHHVVSHITSSTTNFADIPNSNVASTVDPVPEPPTMNRSASVREPTKPTSHAAPSAILARTPEGPAEAGHGPPTSRPQKGTRHTLQAEYVAPKSHTNRGEPPEAIVAPTNAYRPGIEDPDAQHHDLDQQPQSLQKQLPQLPQDGLAPQPQDNGRSNAVQPKMPPPTRPARDVPRSVSDSTGAFAAQANQFTTRPGTQGSIASSGHTRSDLRLPSRGSYGQPVAPTVAITNAQGRVTQPAKSARAYNIGGPGIAQHAPQESIGQPTVQQMPPSSYQPAQKPAHHRRSSTLSGLGERLFGRSASIRKKDEDRQKNGKRYPPTSMRPYQTDGEAQPRMSTDSKRSFSFGLGKKRSTDLDSQNEKSGGRRFSLLPQSWSLKNMGTGNRDYQADPQSPHMAEYSNSRPPTGQQYSNQHDGSYDRPSKVNNFSRPPQAQYRQQPVTTQDSYDAYGGTGVYSPPGQSRSQHNRNISQPMAQMQPQYPEGFNDTGRPSMQQGRPGRTVLTKQNRKFNDGYDQDGHHSGSSGAVKKVQAFFRRRARADSEYR